MRSSILFAACVTATNAFSLYFYVEPMKASDFQLDPQTHTVEFKICAPNNAYEQGGNGAVNCSLAWNTTAAPACYTSCGNSQSGNYAARITPDSYLGADNFSVDVFQSYVYELTNYNYATIPIAPGLNGSSYACTAAGQSTTCSTADGGQGFNQTESEHFGGSAPEGAVFCS